ncbi:hypothetical protein GGTG_04205 [Gaeumannomyces tritici R3-111a-1]|uniref:Uncharacterized protein n=1 Tax=Gaeumannomyces tritici (strain R3-111a-1) TaxID=644352 RepID=J3NSF3_GAET3|nr:hypothetical protein GGTG_04205 [Gaeumannomyces tritici R3-111a-1]EJT79116.1 hypothetical protein GGTG_04205 [Gaeumannomyces tritici R3-111a-1]
MYICDSDAKPRPTPICCSGCARSTPRMADAKQKLTTAATAPGPGEGRGDDGEDAPDLSPCADQQESVGQASSSLALNGLTHLLVLQLGHGSVCRYVRGSLAWVAQPQNEDRAAGADENGPDFQLELMGRLAMRVPPQDGCQPAYDGDDGNAAQKCLSNHELDLDCRNPNLQVCTHESGLA